jgi:hypothetical protein
MTAIPYKKLAVILLTLLIISELLFRMVESGWVLKDHRSLAMLVIYLRTFTSFALLFLGVFAAITKRILKIKIQWAGLLIFIGFMFSNLSVAPSIASLFFAKDIGLSYLPQAEAVRFVSIMDGQKDYLIYAGILFLTFLGLLSASIKFKLYNNINFE